MKIKMTSVLVDDQDKARTFYTEVLGFVAKSDIPLDGIRWLTVVSPEGGDIELLLEPTGYEFARTYQKALFDAGIPMTVFFADDIRSEHERMAQRGVRFSKEPTESETGVEAVFEDTCGNLIGLMQVRAS